MTNNDNCELLAAVVLRKIKEKLVACCMNLIERDLKLNFVVYFDTLF